MKLCTKFKPDLLAKLSDYAAIHGITASEAVRRAVEDMVNEPPPGAITVPGGWYTVTSGASITNGVTVGNTSSVVTTGRNHTITHA